MQHGNGSSYKAIIYILLVAFSFLVMHLNLKLKYYYYKQELKNIDIRNNEKMAQKSAEPQKSTIKRVPKVEDTLAVKDEVTEVMNDTAVAVTDEPGDREYFENLLENYKAGISISDGSSQPRKDVVIRYYKKDKDGDRVYKLRELGFYIHERPAEGDFDHFGSNAIFYGDEVTNEDLAVIAYYLIDNGLELQSISLSKFHDTWKAHSVEIGTDTTVLDQPYLTLSSLRKTWRDF